MTAIRYVGIDIHKKHFTVAAVDNQQQELLAPQRIAVQKFTAWANEHLKSTDQVAIEATINSWAVHDLLSPLVDHVAVANTNLP